MTSIQFYNVTITLSDDAYEAIRKHPTALSSGVIAWSHRFPVFKEEDGVFKLIINSKKTYVTDFRLNQQTSLRVNGLKLKLELEQITGYKVDLEPRIGYEVELAFTERALRYLSKRPNHPHFRITRGGQNHVLADNTADFLIFLNDVDMFNNRICVKDYFEVGDVLWFMQNGNRVRDAIKKLQEELEGEPEEIDLFEGME